MFLSRKLLALGIFLVLIFALAAVLIKSQRKKSLRSSQPGAFQTQPDSKVFAGYATSKNCKSCHAEIFKLWESSHHALAERLVRTNLDSKAFDPPKEISHGSQHSSTSLSNGIFQITTAATNGMHQSFVPRRVIGVDPLRQFLVQTPGGRWQSTEIAVAPDTHTWFDVFGNEDRKPGEWGHWSGRGMTWNAMCAACHNTRLRKHYQKETDIYQTTMAEMGVGCEACHGPMASHQTSQIQKGRGSKGANKGQAAPIPRITREQMFSACGTCHSRRAELTGDFIPGEGFFDHFALTIPDETETYYADGQVREEDYEYASFLSSRMGASGVRCIDCHEAHSGKIRLPGNSLCLACHATPTPPAPKIDPDSHTHHPVGTSGYQCVGCHMPQTTYMQRHARRDHGFTIPDPLLTKQHEIPNACNRCHTDRTVDWALSTVEGWYGQRMERPSRTRAQIVARSRKGDPKAAQELVGVLRTETNAFWRAVSAGLLKRWVGDKQVLSALVSSVSDTNPLVRSMSLRALEPLSQSADSIVQVALRNCLDDSVRSVRVEAAWALRATLDTNSVAGRDLVTYLEHNSDQPAGQLQLGLFALDRRDLNGAASCFERAIQWDPNSPPLHDALAVALSLQGQPGRAVDELQIACRLAPRDAELRFKLGLALNEAGKADAARAALQEAVKLDPQYAQAWYNLGLAWDGTGQTDSALESLSRAESLDANSPQIPYARATILARLGRFEEARNAARRALSLQPDYANAENLIQQLSGK